MSAKLDELQPAKICAVSGSGVLRRSLSLYKSNRIEFDLNGKYISTMRCSQGLVLQSLTLWMCIRNFIGGN